MVMSEAELLKAMLEGKNNEDMLNLSVDVENLKQDLQLILDVVGSDPAEQACENECHVLLKDGHVLNYACPFVCHG